MSNLPKKRENTPLSSLKQQLAMISMVGLSLGVFAGSLFIGFNQVFTGKVFDPNPVMEIPPQLKRTEFSRAEYERLNTETGMLLEAVEAILGRGTEIGKTFKTATYVWKQADDSEIIAIFESGKLKSKAQKRLR
jgi:hypothetical protein